MSSDSLGIADLARYLQRDARDLEKLASQGRLPARRVAGDWRFNRAEVNDWLEQSFPDLSDRQLENLEAGVQGKVAQHCKLERLVTRLLCPATMAVPLAGRTAPGVLNELVDVANGAWQVYQPEKILAAVRAREELCSTAVPGGAAIPHPRQPMPDCLGESLIALGRTNSGIPFGGGGPLTDIFFLVLCRDSKLHLQVLARLSRMLQREHFLERIRAAESVSETLAIIQETEDQVLA